MTTPSVIGLDVNETLIDIESLAPLFESLFGRTRFEFATKHVTKYRQC